MWRWWQNLGGWWIKWRSQGCHALSYGRSRWSIIEIVRCSKRNIGIQRPILLLLLLQTPLLLVPNTLTSPHTLTTAMLSITSCCIASAVIDIQLKILWSRIRQWVRIIISIGWQSWRRRRCYCSSSAALEWTPGKTKLHHCLYALECSLVWAILLYQKRYSVNNAPSLNEWAMTLQEAEIPSISS